MASVFWEQIYKMEHRDTKTPENAMRSFPVCRPHLLENRCLAFDEKMRTSL